MLLSKRIMSMQESPIRKLVPYADAAKMRGKKIYHLNIGQPDIETPASFIDSIKKFDEKILAYSLSRGSTELINCISSYYAKHGIDFKNDEILITNGGSEAILFSIMATMDPDDEILIPEPFYTNYNGFCTAASVNILPITCKTEDGFHLPCKETIEKIITAKTKAILLSHPGNPTGVVYTKDEIHMIAELAKKHNLFIIADEVYREFVYDGSKFMSFATIKEVEDRVIIVDSISKRYSACGARIGSIASKNKKLMEQILKLCQGRLSVPTLEQIGAIEMYRTTPDTYFEAINREYDKRREIVYEALQSMPGVLCRKPNGAFYIIAKLPIDDAEKFVIWLLSEFDVDGATVMLAPAEDFYATPGLGKDEIRIAYVLNTDDLTKSMEILKLALKSYPNTTV